MNRKIGSDRIAAILNDKPQGGAMQKRHRLSSFSSFSLLRGSISNNCSLAPIFMRKFRFNRRVRPGVIGRLHSFIAALLLILSASVAGESDVWIYKVVGGDAHFQSAKWCGDTSKVVWQGVTTGPYVADLSDGKTRNISENRNHTKLFCSPDGRYVFYLDEISGLRMSYDTLSRKTKAISCTERDVSLSPDINTAVSITGKCQKITLPWGGDLPVKQVINVMLPEHYPNPYVAAWLSGNQKLVLRFTRKPSDGSVPQHASLAIYDLRRGVLIPMNLPLLFPTSVKASENGDFIYFLAKPGPEKLPLKLSPLHLYRVSVSDDRFVLELLHSNVLGFDVHRDRQLVVMKEDQSIWIGDVNALSLKKVTDWSEVSPPLFDPKGNALLLTRLDQKNYKEGPEGPPVTSSVYILSRAR
jgi:hypothetical protein